MIDIKVRHHFETSGFNLNVDFSIPDKGVTAVLGPSGSGKTSLLKCVSGLLRADNALVKFNSEVWQDEHVFIAPYERSIGYVFQEGSLLPHLTGKENIEYAVSRARRKLPYCDYNEIVKLFGIECQLSQRPSEMSGGERQRVSLAVAILKGSSVLLLDEPLAALDSERKNSLISFFEFVKAEFSLPMIYVTHSLNEIENLADTVIVMNNGSVELIGGADETIDNLTKRITLILSGDQTEIDIPNQVACKKIRIKIRSDQCLFYKSAPNKNDSAIIFPVKVISKTNNVTLLSYMHQTIKIWRDINFEVNSEISMLCVNPIIIFEK